MDKKRPNYEGEPLQPPPEKTAPLLPALEADLNPNNRITLILRAYHHSTDEQPFSIEPEPNYTTECKTKEDPWTRRMKVGEEWEEVDLGWLQDTAGLVVLINTEGTHRSQVNPSQEQRDETAKKLVEVRTCEGDINPLLLPPGEFLPIKVDNPRLLKIKSEHGRARVTVYAFPK